ncbi:MAG: hypothetical protein FWB90_03115 [Fibromonadales bacterium]|nr:hypothetical protein [Fibromonadales bacterium]
MPFLLFIFLLNSIIFAQVPGIVADYESFLDDINATIESIIPEISNFEVQKTAVNAEFPKPKDEFESTQDYEQRVKDFEKNRAAKITALEKDFKAKTKNSMERLTKAITGKEDWQPNWEGSLKNDAGIEEYRARIEKFESQSVIMRGRISQITMKLSKLNLERKDLEKLENSFLAKNTLYLSRLERAGELMEDYILQEQAKILSTEKYKPQMALGAYDPDEELFDVSVNDVENTKVPFVFSGKAKIPPIEARETNRETTNFAASVDYINLPLATGQGVFYPGAKKVRLYYKDKEVPVQGSLGHIDWMVSLPGYHEWKVFADSLLSGTLVPKNLGPSHAMSTAGMKIPSGVSSSSSSDGSFVSVRTVMRILASSLAAASVGTALYFDSDVVSKGEKASDLYVEAYKHRNDFSYTEKYYAYQRSMDDVKKSENFRNGAYIFAAGFTAAGILTFVF